MLQDALRALGVEDVGLRKWTLAVVYSLHGGSQRFGEVRDSLVGVTDRALALALKELQAAGLVERTIHAEYPPAPHYLATPTAQRLMPILQQL
jgi:DNA-binding HxlR family transcriptional regulator